MPKTAIALGVTGSIAAYKAADLCSKLTKHSIDPVVIMTKSAQQLVGEQTFFTLSKNPVVTSLWEVPDWRPGHIDLADRAKLLVVAPATANFIGKYTHGIADDPLTTFALSHNGPVLIAPAMNPRMWNHPAVQTNVETLKQRGVYFVGPADGVVACGDKGTGKLANVEDILKSTLEILELR